jgi:hypothetical protein
MTRGASLIVVQLATVLAVAAAPSASGGVSPADVMNALTVGRSRTSQVDAQHHSTGSCTMAVPSTQATVEAEIANAEDFCELVSHVLANTVFRAPVSVTPGALWHYAGAALSCRLGYGNTPYRMTIRNSPAACRWLRRLAPDWHFEAAPAE